MTSGDAVVQVLAQRGFGLDEARSRAVLLRQAEQGLRRLTDEKARWCWFVPGRLEVFGKHTDYGGGRTLVAAVPRGFAVAATMRADHVVRAHDARNDEVCEIRLDSPDTPSGWRSYVAVTARRLAANFPGSELGVDVAFASDLPRAAGLSSSSALIIALANVLIQRGRLEERDEWSRAIRSVAERVEYFGCIENGSSYRSLAGAQGVGTEGGSEDHAAILMGRADRLMQFRFAPLERLSDVLLPQAWTFAIASSGVHADKAGTVRTRYNRAARAAQALIGVWNRTADVPAHSLALALASAPDAADRLRDAILRTPTGDLSHADLLRRLDHFIREDGRVPLAANAFASEDAVTLGELSRASQTDADRLLGNQVAETNDLVEAGRAAGALAASSFGAGFGGSAWALVPVDDAARFGEAWTARYRARHPARAGACWFVARPAPGNFEISIDA